MSLGCGAVPEAEAVVAGLQDVAVVGEPVEQRRGHLGIPEDCRPLTETEIGGDDDTGLLVQLAEQVKQQGTPRGTTGCDGACRSNFFRGSKDIRLQGFGLELMDHAFSRLAPTLARIRFVLRPLLGTT